MTNTRVPHEYADLLDRILAPLPESQRLYVASRSPRLVHATAVRHDSTVTTETLDSGWLPRLSPGLRFSDGIPSDVDHVLALEPTGRDNLDDTLGSIPSRTPCDCVVANPFSFNRVEDRSLDTWCSPVSAWRSLRAHGYVVTVEGMHGVRSLAQSVRGRLSQSLGRLDRRDVYTHRMRAAYRERWLPLALSSCFVHLSGVSRDGL